MALTPQQTQELQKTIEQRRRVLMQEMREDLDRMRRENQEEIAGPAGDPGDESVATLIGELARAELNRDVTELQGLDAARSRMAEGSYGSCVDCGGDIDVERLRVNPSAVRCIDCQSMHEKTHNGINPPTL
jgi:RNA polymerase-binding protein DksA